MPQETLRAGIDLLTALAEEVETHLGRRQRSAVAAVLLEQSSEVLEMLGASLSQALTRGGLLKGKPSHVTPLWLLLAAQ